jgi:hypothetical protein
MSPDTAPMPSQTRLSPERQSEVLDVQLLDVLAEIEALLRGGREVQREALRVRGVPSPVTPAQRKAAATKIQKRVAEMDAECRTLCDIVRDLAQAAKNLRSAIDE